MILFVVPVSAGLAGRSEQPPVRYRNVSMWRFVRSEIAHVWETMRRRLVR